jgi:hypothetical protein
MAKATIEFDLDNVDDKMAHFRATKSLDMALALWSIVHNTKKTLEWSFEGKEIDKYDALELVFEKIHEIYDEFGIRVDELIE